METHPIELNSLIARKLDSLNSFLNHLSSLICTNSNESLTAKLNSKLAKILNSQSQNSENFDRDRNQSHEINDSRKCVCEDRFSHDFGFVPAAGRIFTVFNAFSFGSYFPAFLHSLEKNAFSSSVHQPISRLASLPRLFLYSCLFVFIGGSLSPVFSQTSATSPASGYLLKTLQPETDQWLSLPLVQESIFFGKVLWIDNTSLTLSNANWSENQLQNLSLEITSGTSKGRIFTILTNQTDTVQINPQGLLLSSLISTTDTVRIRPVPTVASSFGTSTADLVLSSFATHPTAIEKDLQDQLLIPQPQNSTPRKTSFKRYGFVQSQGWRELDDATTDQTNLLLPPTQGFAIRKGTGAIVDLVQVGMETKLPRFLSLSEGNSNRTRDYTLPWACTSTVKLDDSGIYNSDPIQSIILTSASSNERTDEVQFFSQNPTGFDRPADRVFYYLAGQGWREVGSTATNIGQTVFLEPGKVIIIRKRSGSPAREWKQTPEVLN